MPPALADDCMTSDLKDLGNLSCVLPGLPGLGSKVSLSKGHLVRFKEERDPHPAAAGG